MYPICIACVRNLTIPTRYYACLSLYLERLFCFMYQTYLALQHGGVYLVTIDIEFSEVTAPYQGVYIHRNVIIIFLTSCPLINPPARS